MRRALLALCLLVGLGALAAEPLAAPARPRPRVWDVPRPLGVLEVPGRTRALGMPVGIHAVRSAEKVDALELHFRRQFQAAGLFLPPSHHVVPLSREVQVTGLDPDTYIAYTVFLQPNPDGTTTVILTEAFLEERRRQASGDVFAPVMPGARGVLTSRTESTAVQQYAVKAGPEAVRSFHQQALTRAGYRELEPGVFQRGTDVLRVSARALGEGESVVVVVKQPDAAGSLGSGPEKETP